MEADFYKLADEEWIAGLGLPRILIVKCDLKGGRWVLRAGRESVDTHESALKRLSVPHSLEWAFRG